MHLNNIKTMQIKKITVGLAILGALPVLAFAQTPSSSVTTSGAPVRMANMASTTKDVAYYIQRGDAAVAQRIASLNKYSANVDEAKNLTAEQKATIKAPITAAIDAMNAAKAKLDADTDLAAAKADYNAILRDNRIYMVVIPQSRAVKSADQDNYRLSTSTSRVTELQAKIDEAKAAGKDTSVAQQALNDAKAKLAGIPAKVSFELSEAAKLVVDHGDKNLVTANKAADANVKMTRKSIDSDFKAVAADFKAVRTALGLGGNH